MINSKVFITLLLLVFSLFSLPASHYSMISVGDPVLDDLRFLSIEAGRSFTSFTPPLTPHEVESFLNSLDTSILSTPALSAYNRIRERLTPQRALTLISSDTFTFNLNMNSNLELRANTNTDIGWYYIYPKVTPLFSWPVNIFFMDSVQLFIEPMITLSPRFYFSDNDAFIFNTGSFTYFDYDWSMMPFRAYIAMGGSFWNFQLGRDRLTYGTGHMGNMVISDNPDYYEFFRLSFFSENFKYSMLINQMPMDIRRGYHNLDPLNDELDRTMQRHYYLHRLDFNFRNKFSLALMEGVMVGNSPLEIRFLNPLMIFHSLFSWENYDHWIPSDKRSMIGSLLSLEANWNIIPSLSLYSQFVMTEFATGGEVKTNPNQAPNGYGFMAGVNYSHSFNTWASNFFFEFTGTSPFLYMKGSPFGTFIHMRYISDNRGELFTFPGYMRDLYIFTLGGNFFKDDEINISGILSLLLNGERNTNYDWEKSTAAFNARTPSGTTETKFTASFSIGYKINTFINLNASLTGIYSHNNNHQRGTNEFGLQSSLSVGFSY